MQRTRNETRSTSSSTSSSAIGTASRLSAYTAAATGAMLASSSADAAVTIVNVSINADAPIFSIDLDVGRTGYYSVVGVADSMVSGKFNAGAFATKTTQPDASQFVANALVGASATLDSNDAWNGGTPPLYLPTSGNTAYLGFRLTVGASNLLPAGNIYGWIEFVNDGGSTTVSRWAYESEVNTGITTPSVSAVPGGAGLAALAFGAAGVRGRRRQHC